MKWCRSYTRSKWSVAGRVLVGHQLERISWHLYKPGGYNHKANLKPFITANGWTGWCTGKAQCLYWQGVRISDRTPGSWLDTLRLFSVYPSRCPDSATLNKLRRFAAKFLHSILPGSIAGVKDKDIKWRLCKIEFTVHRNSFYWIVFSNNKMRDVKSLYEP